VKVLPTLHIQNGRVVPSFSNGPQAGLAPMEVVDVLLEMGHCRFAMVDVDAARSQGSNRETIGNLIRRIRRAGPKVCIQVGGGICSSDHAQFFLNLGATWLLVGTVLHRYPMVVDQLLARFRDNLMASVDARAGEVQIDGRRKSKGLLAGELAANIRELGFKRLLFADIPPEPEAEPDFGTARSICEKARIPVFMGGSLRSQEHLARAEEIRGLQGVFLDAIDVVNLPRTVTSPASPCA
jgi:phosphoribosylformimino-5-aminoimidazole carboxamide ribotide isomerase